MRANMPTWVFPAGRCLQIPVVFAKLTTRRLKRGVFRSIVDLQAAINRFLAETNAYLKPFTWTKDPKKTSLPSNEDTKC
jgi:hypothetical protein